MRRVFLLLPLCLAAAACGGTTSGSGGHSDEPAALTLVQDFDPSHGMFIEGFLWKLRVHGSDGTTAYDHVVGKNTVELTLQPGSYRVDSAVQACDGNCGYLDGPQDACTTDLDLRSGEHRRVVVHIAAGRPCVFEA